MNYYTELLESYNLLKKRALRVSLNEALKPYSAIIQSNPNLVAPISTEMETLTGLGSDDQEPQLEVMKGVLQVQTRVVAGEGEGSEGGGKTITWYTAKGDSGPITIIGARGGFDKQGWKTLQGQVARRFESQNPNTQNAYKSSGRDILEDPLLSDTAKTEEERLHAQSTAEEIRQMSTTTLPNLIGAGFAGDPGKVTKKDSDAPGWVKDPKNHLDSYSLQSLWSKVNNEKVTEVAKIIESEGGTFAGEKANWEDKHEGVTSMHEFARKCMKLQQYINGDEGAFTDNDARWVHTNVILDNTNNKVRYNKGEIDGYGISFDHTTTKRSMQKETMSVGLARIYNEKIQEWVADRNKRIPDGDQITSEQFEVPEKKLVPEQLKNAKWCSDFRGTQAEKIVGFVPHIIEISRMLRDYEDSDKRVSGSKELKEELQRKKDLMATEMSKLFGENAAVLGEAFKVAKWEKDGEILSDEYTEGITQTVTALKRLGKNEREIVKQLFNRIVTNQFQFFDTVNPDLVFNTGGRTGPSEKADNYAVKTDRDDYMRALKDMGVEDKKKRERIVKANTTTLRYLAEGELGSKLKGLSDEEKTGMITNLVNSKKLYKDRDVTFDLDQPMYSIPLSLKTYITETDTRLGQTRAMVDTIGMMLDPTDSKHYKKNQDQAKVERFVKQNEESLGIGTENGPSRESYRDMMGKLRSIGEVGNMIKGDDRIKGMGQTDVARVVKDLIRGANGVPSLNEKFLLDYLTKNFERDKEDGRESVRLASFVERQLMETAERSILKSPDQEKKLSYRTALASISMFTGMSADSTFAMEMDLINNKSKLYNQDDCIKEQAVRMQRGTLPLKRTSVSNDFGNMSLKFERKGNSSVFGLKTSEGCENILKGNLKESVLQDFLKAQALLFETLLV